MGEAADGQMALQLCQQSQPDVLVLDIAMPGSPPSETVVELRGCCPEVKIVVLSAYDDDLIVRRLAALGIAGYVLKDDALDAIVHAIRSVARGGTWFSRPVLAKLVEWGTSQASPSMESTLTERERVVLHLLMQGNSDLEIGQALGLAERTVRKEVRDICDKFAVTTRIEAAVRAVQLGLT